jgi:hypothetical protein
MRDVVERHVELWNAGDKDAWLAHWKSANSGEPSMEDPVGTPVKRGWEEMEATWDASMTSGLQLTIKTLYVCGGTTAVVMQNDGRVGDVAFSMDTIELYHFSDDGSIHAQAYWDPAAGAAQA